MMSIIGEMRPGLLNFVGFLLKMRHAVPTYRLRTWRRSHVSREPGLRSIL
ncbi:unnamed protein product, partial [Amoebophrya sp. A25]|eukprot:GSA25T00027442001.1